MSHKSPYWLSVQIFIVGASWVLVSKFLEWINFCPWYMAPAEFGALFMFLGCVGFIAQVLWALWQWCTDDSDPPKPA